MLIEPIIDSYHDYKNYEVTGVVINMQNTTIFEQFILPGCCTSK